MTLFRILIPTALLFAGAAAAQPPAPTPPPTPPQAVPAPAEEAPTPAPPAARQRAGRAFAPDAPMAPLPPRAMLAPVAPEWQDAPPTPAPAPVPHPAPKPAIADFDAPMPPMPPIDFDQDRLFELKEKIVDMEHNFKFDFDFDFPDMNDKIAIAGDRLSEMKMKFPFAFAPQAAGMGGKIRQNMSDDRAYEAGQRALEGRRYTEALEYFNQVAARGGNRADGAWYWKAYSLIKLGRADEARAALAELRKNYASSRWLDDAKALEVEAGKPVSPESESDEELKLIALNGLMQSDPDRAYPLLDNLLKSAQPPKIKRNAVYVLAQSNSPKAQQLLEQVARGEGNPDLQLTAIRYLGERRRQGGSNPVLAEIYNSSNDVNVKRAILNSLEGARDKDRLLQIAKTEKQQDLRLHAIRMLGSIQGTQSDIWALYQAEPTVEGKQQILETISGSAGNLDKLLEVARTEKEIKLRRFAINNLATSRAASTGDTLASMYTSEQDQDVKRSIIDALASQKNVKAMIQIARAEKDNRMQQRILERLVNMKSPEASDYLMEIIKK